MYYDKQIRYIDYLENGEKQRNCGYVKMTVTDNRLLLEMQIKGLYETDDVASEVTLEGAGAEHRIGTILIRQGSGSFQWEIKDTAHAGEELALGEGLRYGQLEQVRVQLSPRRSLRCVWREVLTRPKADKRGMGNALQAEGTALSKLEQESKVRILEPTMAEQGDEKKRAEQSGSDFNAIPSAPRLLESDEVRQAYDLTAAVSRAADIEKRAVGKNVVERALGNMTESAAERVPGNMAESAAERVPGNMAESVAERVFGNMAESAIERAPGNMTESAAERTPKNMAESMAERALKNVSGGNAEERNYTSRVNADITESTTDTPAGGGGQNEIAGRTEIESQNEIASRTGIEIQSDTAGRTGIETQSEIGSGIGIETQIGIAGRTGIETHSEIGSRTGIETQNEIQDKMHGALKNVMEMTEAHGNVDVGIEEKAKAVSGDSRAPRLPRGSRTQTATESGKPSRPPHMASMCEDKWQQLQKIYPHIRPFQDEREYLSLRPEDFVILHSGAYQLVQNSFLLHGYYNYDHLILTQVSQRGGSQFYIGVPGNFYEKEKQVAIMYGFGSFECRQEPAREGDFGYYMIKVEL